MPRYILSALTLALSCLMLFSCADHTAQDDDKVDQPSVTYTKLEIKEEEDDTVLYQCDVNLPKLLLPAGEGNADAINGAIEQMCRTWAQCPIDTETLKNKWQSSPSAFQPYRRYVNLQMTLLDENYLSFSVGIETTGGGISTDYEVYGITFSMKNKTSDLVYLYDAIGISEQDARNAVIRAFEKDMKVHPQYYDDPEGEVLSEWFSPDGYYLTQRGVTVFLANDTISIGASPELSFTKDELIALSAEAE